jgi:hypothetical protein
MRRQKNKDTVRRSIKSQIEIIELNSQTGGYRVRVGLRAGDWQCNSCSGKTMGTQLFKAHCGYCIKQ